MQIDILLFIAGVGAVSRGYREATKVSLWQWHHKAFPIPTETTLIQILLFSELVMLTETGPAWTIRISCLMDDRRWNSFM